MAEAKRAVVGQLPAELRFAICTLDTSASGATYSPVTAHGWFDNVDPAASGKNPFLDIPPELRSQIYNYLLPGKELVVRPSTKPKEGTQTRDLMVLNRQICTEISAILYESNTFAVDVYEGVTEGGIEFLNSGRQRLQYRERFSQVRFKRFEGESDPFGFHRIKRLQINVHHAAPENVQKRKSVRHDSMHTHFMMRALANLLQHTDGSFGLNHLKVCFVEGAHHRSRSVDIAQHWFNCATEAPLSTSIHGVSNVEIITRPLMRLRRVQQADFELHPLLFQDEVLSNFIDRVSTIITSKLRIPVIPDELDSKIEHARDLLEEWLYLERLSRPSVPIAGLDASDFMDVDQESWDLMLRNNSNHQHGHDGFDGVYGSSLLPDEDGFFDLPGCETDPAELKRKSSDTASIEADTPSTRTSDGLYEMRTMSAREDIQEPETEQRAPPSPAAKRRRSRRLAKKNWLPVHADEDEAVEQTSATPEKVEYEDEDEDEDGTVDLGEADTASAHVN